MNSDKSFLKRYTSNEDRLLASRALDLAAQAERGSVCFSDFLSPAERSLIRGIKELNAMCDVTFCGGYADAERTRAMFAPKDIYYEPEAPITVIEIKVRGGEVSHRDILGSVLGLGIVRGKVGDIIIGGGSPVLICDEDIASYICNNIERIGRCSVKAVPGSISSIPEPKLETITATVMSLRLDSILAEAFSLSRTAAASVIKGGTCFVNWVQTDSPSHMLKQGDTITLRGKGRARLEHVGGQSKKGRTFIEISKFI